MRANKRTKSLQKRFDLHSLDEEVREEIHKLLVRPVKLLKFHDHPVGFYGIPGTPVWNIPNQCPLDWNKACQVGVDYCNTDEYDVHPSEEEYEWKAEERC